MSWYRGILVGLSLVAAVAHAQQPAPHVRKGVWRTIDVPLANQPPEAVPEVRVAPGSATLLRLPEQIFARDGFVVVGGEGRVVAQRVTPTTLVLVPSTEIGPERVPLAVATIDGRRYPFLLATRPDVVDIEVQVALVERPRAEDRDDAIVEGLLKRKHVFARQYERPGASQQEADMAMADWGTPFVECAVRMGNRYFILVANQTVRPWKVDQANLEGPNGKLLKVQAIRWEGAPVRDTYLNENFNVIVAEVPDNAGADYALKSIELVGRDAPLLVQLDQKVILP